MIEAKTVYFEKPGVENTEKVFRVAKQRAGELDIKTILVASTTGYTAVKAVEALKGLRVIAISHSVGWRDPNTQEFTEENQKTVKSRGGTIFTATHVFAGISQALRSKSETVTIGGITADVLRIFGSGTKVACEIAMMAADGGLVRTDEEIIAIAGTGSQGRGSDTALVLTPVTSQNFFDLKVKEIICKPRF